MVDVPRSAGRDNGSGGAGGGIAPVPPERRVLGGWDTFILWADLGISFLVMVVGMFLVPGLGFLQALLAILVGAAIGNVLLGLAATIGSDTGVPTMVLLRAPLGVRGSYAPTALNVIQLIGWAALEVIVMAQATDALTTRFLGLPAAYHLWVLVFALLTMAMALWGPVRVTKQWLEKFAVWAVLASTVWITVALLATPGVWAALSKPGTGETSFWLGVDLVVALPISWFPLVADYSRLSRSRRGAFWGTGLGYFVPQAWFYSLGAALVLVRGVEGDASAPIAPLLGAIAGLTAGWLALLVLLVAETDEGFANVYSTALSVQNLFPRLGQRGLIVGISGIVLVLAWLVPLAQYESFLLLIGSAFVPLLGVVAADYFVRRRGHYDVAALYRTTGEYWYTGGVSWPGIVTWLIGVATYLTISGVRALGINGVAPSLGASLPSFIVAFVLHVLLGRVAARQAPAALAGTPSP
jgi:putative hydroxymethylpyrimidine transporter CytX